MCVSNSSIGHVSPVNQPGAGASPFRFTLITSSSTEFDFSKLREVEISVSGCRQMGYRAVISVEASATSSADVVAADDADPFIARVKAHADNVLRPAALRTDREGVTAAHMSQLGKLGLLRPFRASEVRRCGDRPRRGPYSPRDHRRCLLQHLAGMGSTRDHGRPPHPGLPERCRTARPVSRGIRGTRPTGRGYQRRPEVPRLLHRRRPHGRRVGVHRHHLMGQWMGPQCGAGGRRR